MPKDRVTQSHQGYGFVEFLAEDDADYAIKIMNMIKLYGKPIRVNKVKLFNTSFFINIKIYSDVELCDFCIICTRLYYINLYLYFFVLGIRSSKES